MLAANVPPGTRALLGDLRAGLGPDVTLIGSEGFYDDLSPAGQAARGMYVAYPGAAVEVLPREGKRFLKALEARTGKPGLFYTADAAQAAEILLDAIARSDGTRPSVTRQLFQTRVKNGLLGNISFDENGDPVEAPVTIYRWAGGKAGFVADRVVMARAAAPR
jgi:branched-chain amino acid transport system substrate-binding protein